MSKKSRHRHHKREKIREMWRRREARNRSLAGEKVLPLHQLSGVDKEGTAMLAYFLESVALNDESGVV